MFNRRTWCYYSLLIFIIIIVCYLLSPSLTWSTFNRKKWRWPIIIKFITIIFNSVVSRNSHKMCYYGFCVTYLTFADRFLSGHRWTSCCVPASPYTSSLLLLTYLYFAQWIHFIICRRSCWPFSALIRSNSMRECEWWIQIAALAKK